MSAAVESPARLRIAVSGVVQGVGFRPFIYGLATRLALTGFVGNDSSGVLIEVEGLPAALAEFQYALEAEKPPPAYIEAVRVEPAAPVGDAAFVIVASTAQPAAATLVSPDLCICDDCLRELFDPDDRRYRYPFINCTNCGPRFTITRDIPYDRPLTTMAPFVMCPACQAEYDDPRNRRFHAQPNACPACGPQVWFCINQTGGAGAGRDLRHESQRDHLVDASLCPPTTMGDDAIRAAQNALAAGQIVAVKGLGGFHLACSATDDAAVAELRKRKGRIDKPFAVMARDLTGVEAIAHVDDDERRLLMQRERPIVLLRKRMGSPLSDLVAPGNGYVGVMLPYTPLHSLLVTNFELRLTNDGVRDLQESPHISRPSPLLVMTSGNYSDEPIVTENEAALERLTGLADGWLLHDRKIHVPCDDSVVRIFGGRELPVRRSRGYAPLPVKLPFAVRPLLAVGGELKATFCLTHQHHAFMSQHIGDMENLETLLAFERAAEHMQTIFRIDPEAIACDLHPRYLSTRWAHEQARGRAVVEVQHHHAHIAAVMAEHGLDGTQPVIGFSFDGTGYGTDGASWGGEALVVDYRGFLRAAHLAYVPLPGGDAAVKRPYRIALAHLYAAGVDWDEALPAVAAATVTERRVLRRQFETGFQTVPTSSMGRLFDGVAALAGVRQTVTYEGQAAIELEAVAGAHAENSSAYEFALREKEGQLLFDAAPVIRAVVADVLLGLPAPPIASRFHRAVADLCLTLSLRLREEHGLSTVALSGGVFQNVTLLRLTAARLEAAGFTVLWHRLVPPNDGGLALGQAVIAHHQLAYSHII